MLEKLKEKLRKDTAGMTSPGLDFLPDGYVERKRRRRTDAITLSVFVVVVAGVGTAISYGERSLRAVEAESMRLDSEYAEAAKRIEQVRQMREKQKMVADRMELTASLLEKLPRSNVVAEVTNALPSGVSLTESKLEAEQLKAPTPVQTSFDKKAGTPPPAALPQPLRYDTTLTLTGLAYTEGQVSDYIDQLGRSSYFSAVDLKWVRKGSSVNKDDDTMRTFMVALTIDPEAEARLGDNHMEEAPVPTQAFVTNAAEVAPATAE